MDIKVITGAVGLVITIGGLFIFQGQLIQRIDVLEAQKAPNIKPLEPVSYTHLTLPTSDLV